MTVPFAEVLNGIKFYSRRICRHGSTWLFIPPVSDLPRLARWMFVRFLLLAILIMLISDAFIPIIGSMYIKSRTSLPSKSPPGLSLVDSRESTLPAAVDIVFVHGLGAFPDTTWRKQRPQDSDSNSTSSTEASWIRDLLPNDLPQARLMYFNYDSTSYNDAPQKDLEDFALELLNAFDISQLRTTKQEKTRPLIFLCHSYGGLVVKEALVQASREPKKYHDILLNTEGLVFLGTPHFGTKYAGYARKAALRLDRLGSNPDIFLPLTVNSSQLVELHEEFLERFRDLEIVNFYETHKQILFKTYFGKIPYRVMIVEKESATFRAPNTTNDSIDTDHSGLNKYDSSNDQGYIKILFYLTSMTRKIIRQRRLQREKEEAALMSKIHNTSDSITSLSCASVPRYVVDPHTVKSFTPRRGLMKQIIEDLADVVPGSDPPRSVALWGIGGAGKSQLALRYVELNRNRYDPIIWINANRPETAAKSYADAFEALDLDFPAHAMDEFRKDEAQDSQTQFVMQTNWVVKAVMYWLARRGDEHCEWLVVIDNADNLLWINDIMPRGPRGSVIMTSRDQLVDRFTNHAIEVGMMTTEEAVELLFRASRTHSDSPNSLEADSRWRTSQGQQALGIVNVLGHLPLAVDLAGAYIAQNDYVRENLTRYMNYISDQSYSLLSTDSPHIRNKYALHIATVWETSFIAIQESHPLSAHLFLILAYFNHACIEDRLFSEASLWLEERRHITSPGKFLLLFFEITALVSSPRIVFWLFKRYVPWKPNLRGLSKRRGTIILFTAPIILNMIALSLVWIIRVRKIQAGDTVRRMGFILDAEDLVILLFTAINYTAPAIADWLFPEGYTFWLIGLLPLYTTLVLITWVWVRFWEARSTVVQQHIKMLLIRLDFTETSMTRFVLLLSGLRKASTSEFGWRLLLELVWYFFWTFLVQVFFIILGGIISALWNAIMSAIENFLKNRNRNNMIKICRWFVYAVNHPASHHALLYLFGFWAGSTGIFTWEPWYTKKKHIFAIDPSLLNLILTMTEDDQWNRRPHSEAMAPITRLSLMQRNRDQSYAMHPLVQWWARHRIPDRERKAWVREAERFIALAYQSRTCWGDADCQQIMVPHLIEVASADARNAEGRFWTLKALLNMLYRSLKFVSNKHV